MTGVYGVDDKLILDRRTRNTTLSVTIKLDIPRIEFKGYTTKYILVNGYMYCILSNSGVDVLLNETHRQHIVTNRFYGMMYGESYYTDLFNDMLTGIRINDCFARQLYRETKCNAFMLIWDVVKAEYMISESTPNLGNLGFGTLKSADDMYKETSCFISSTMEETLTEIDDKYKIESKGFDKKLSFRKGKRWISNVLVVIYNFFKII